MSLFTSDPTREEVGLDADTTRLLRGAKDRATTSVEDIAGQLNAGIGGSEKSVGLDSVQNTEQRSAKTGEDFGMMNAIRNQYKNLAQKDIQSVIRQNKTNAPLARGNMVNNLQAYMTAQGQLQTESAVKLMQANMMAEQARAGALRSILGGAGQMIGMGMASRQPSQPQSQNSFQMPKMGSEYDMNSGFGGPNTFGGSDYAKQLGGSY